MSIIKIKNEERFIKVHFTAYDKPHSEIYSAGLSIEQIKAKLDFICSSYVLHGFTFYDALETGTEKYFYDNSQVNGQEKDKAKRIIDNQTAKKEEPNSGPLTPSDIEE